MMLSALDLLEENPAPDDEEVRAALEGNLCRCTGYQNIVNAVQNAADRMRGADQMQAAADGGERPDGGERTDGGTDLDLTRQYPTSGADDTGGEST